MSIGTLAYKTTAKKSLFQTVQGKYRNPATMNLSGSAAISSAQYKFGTGSLLMSGGSGSNVGYIYSPSNSIFNHGSGNFTYECWVRWTSTIGTQFILDQRADGTNTITPVIYFTGSALNYYVNGAIRITYSFTPTINTWYHVAVCKSGTSTRLFLNGTQVGSTYTDTNTYVQGGNVNIGGTYSLGANQFNGYLDEFRISNIARYTSNFTPSTTPFNNDGNTLLLLHLDTDYQDYVY